MTTTTTTMTASRIDDRPAITLPTLRLLAASVGGALVAGGVWALIGLLSGAVAPMLGVWSGVVVAVVMAASVLAMTPWKPRPLTWLGTLWLGATVLRMLVTPILAWVLYSATSFSAASLALVVGTTYIVSLMAEVGILASAVRRIDPQSSANPKAPFRSGGSRSETPSDARLES